MSYIPEPVTRTDKYLAYIAGNMDVTLPDYPITRKEHYLAAWAEKSGFEDVDVAGDPPLTLENGIGKPLKGLTLYGRSKQVTTTGAQLFPPPSLGSQEKNGITIDCMEGGKIRISGTTETNSDFYLSRLQLPAGTYTFSAGVNIDASVLRYALVAPGGVPYYDVNGDYTTDTIKETIEVKLLLRVYAGKTIDLTVKPMLNAGSASLPWEPYTGGKPSPSPDYPQEIESAGMRWSTGANLLDISQWNTYGKTYGLTCTIENDTVTIKGVYERPNYEIGTRIQAMYRLLRYKTGTTFPDGAKVVAQIIKGDGAEGIYVSSGLKENTPCIVIAFYAVTGQEVEIQLKPMIYVGDTVPEWEPYTGGVPKPYGDKIGINVRGKNLLPTTMYSDSGTINGVKFTNNGDGSITAVGTAADITYFTLYGYNTLGDRGTLPSMEPGDALYISDCLLQQTNSQSIISIDENRSTSFYKSTTTMYAAIRVSKGKNVNKTFFPMISKGSKPIPYEPYRKPQYMSIATPNGLPGIPVSSGGNYTDADGRQWICDEIDLARGMYVQRVAKEVLNGTEQVKWVSQIGDIVRFSIKTKYHAFHNYDADISRKGLNGFFSHGAYYTNYSLNDIHGYADDENMYIFLPIDILGNNAGSIAAYIMEQHENGSPLTMYYIVATQIETPLTDEQIAAYKAIHTYKGTTIIDNDAGAYMSVKYEKMK